jgi:peptidoglycan/xylan/chitin deacetylase (PgdA/CDA1 family)
MSTRSYLLLTFDLEEFDWPLERGYPLDIDTQLRVTCEGLGRLLPVLRRHAIPATFFTTASFATARPVVVRDLVAQGHEIAAHGLRHAHDYETMGTGDVTRVLTEARHILESITGRPVCGFRAPRLRPGSLSAVRQAGYVYGANVHPTQVPGRYRALRAPRHPWREEGLVRVPISVVPVCHWPLSFVWFRLMGAWLATLGARWAVADTGYLQVYFHPWEAMPIAQYGIPRWLAVRTGPRFVHMIDRLLDGTGDLQPDTVAGYVNRISSQLG